ncbi:MAG: DUF1566 domain-containing protein [Paraglaciecola sp.]|nr:DUF1566 domain-containing protein [Paraglaciecola sp.]
MTTYNRFLTVLFFTACLVGCSGSALDSDSDTPSPKVLVDAGTDQSVDEQTTVTLSAQAVGQTDALTFTWSATPAITITQDDTTVGLATFIAPVATEITTYTFTIVVTDADGNTGNDSVVYQINPINALPSAVIQVTQHEGFLNNQFPAGYTVILDATASTDTDSSDINNPIASYLWQQTAGESVLEGVITQGDKLSFEAPLLAETNTITLSLTVTDEEGAEDTVTVTLSILSTQKTLPTVDAGLEHEVFSGESIMLNGQADTSVESAKPLTYTWLSDIEPVSIDNTSAAQTFAIAPAVSNATSIIFTLQVEDAFGNYAQDNITVTVLPLTLQSLNDTGVIQQATNTSFITSHQAGFPGQDGQRGQDIIYFNGMSTKAGRGAQGFDFTALDDIGDEVDDTSQQWRCVRDNITGLIWEVKDPSSTTGLHSSVHSYTWFQLDNNGGFEGDQPGSQASCSLTECNTTAYVAQVNSLGLCNFRDWRLPTYNELFSIMHLGKQTAPLIDDEYFPNTTGSLGTVVWYWTNHSSADGFTDDQAVNAWAIDFASGNDNFLNKATAGRVRLVRAGR